MSDRDTAGVAAPRGAAPMVSRAGWVRCLPFLTYLLFLALAELLGWLGWSAAELRWIYGVKIGAVALVLAIFWRDYGELKDFRLPAPLALRACAMGVAVLGLWLVLGAGWMTLGASAGFDPTSAGKIDWPLVALRIAGAALVVPVMEELFWRAFLMRWIDTADFETVAPSAISIKSVIITSVLFGFEHNLWLAGIVAGLAFGALYRRHRTLWSPIVAHAVTNGLLGVWVVATGSWSYW
jgi:CAAX prenyl protease-like protein